MKNEIKQRTHLHCTRYPSNNMLTTLASAGSAQGLRRSDSERSGYGELNMKVTDVIWRARSWAVPGPRGGSSTDELNRDDCLGRAMVAE